MYAAAARPLSATPQACQLYMRMGCAFVLEVAVTKQSKTQWQGCVYTRTRTHARTRTDTRTHPPAQPRVHRHRAVHLSPAARHLWGGVRPLFVRCVAQYAAGCSARGAIYGAVLVLRRESAPGITHTFLRARARTHTHAQTHARHREQYLR